MFKLDELLYHKKGSFIIHNIHLIHRNPAKTLIAVYPISLRIEYNSFLLLKKEVHCAYLSDEFNL